MKISKPILVISSLIIIALGILFAVRYSQHHAKSAPSPLVGEGGGEGILLSSATPTTTPHPNPLPQGAREQTNSSLPSLNNPSLNNQQPSTNNPLPSPSPTAALISGLTPDLDYQHRLAAIRSLDTNLSAADVACLMAYLADPSTAKEGNLWDLALKNDTLAVLLRQDHLPENLGALLVNIVSNKTQDLTWRDYALQVFPAYAERTPDGADPESQVLRTVIDSALTERGTVLPGTALIAMNRLSATGGLYETNTVATEARKILDQSAAGDPARITAIQILAKTDATNALAMARTMAHNEANPVLERMSAMAALGRVGDADDLKWLQDFARRPEVDSRLKKVADYSVKEHAKCIMKSAGLKE